VAATMELMGDAIVPVCALTARQSLSLAAAGFYVMPHWKPAPPAASLSSANAIASPPSGHHQFRGDQGTASLARSEALALSGNLAPTSEAALAKQSDEARDCGGPALRLIQGGGLGESDVAATQRPWRPRPAASNDAHCLLRAG
jgi:hypothetical protein